MTQQLRGVGYLHQFRICDLRSHSGWCPAVELKAYEQPKRTPLHITLVLASQCRILSTFKLREAIIRLPNLQSQSCQRVSGSRTPSVA